MRLVKANSIHSLTTKKVLYAYTVIVYTCMHVYIIYIYSYIKKFGRNGVSNENMVEDMRAHRPIYTFLCEHNDLLVSPLAADASAGSKQGAQRVNEALNANWENTKTTLNKVSLRLLQALLSALT